MSQNENKRDLSRYDALTTEELEQLLRASLLIEDEDDEYLEMIVYVAELYAKRKKSEVSQTIPYQKPKFKRPAIHRFIRPIAAAAAVAALVFCGTMTARSMGFNLWGAVAEWTSSIFTFDTPDATLSDTDPLETIERMKPKWMPEGFELVEEILNKDEPITYFASYQKDNAEIVLAYSERLSSNIAYSEKSEEEVELYERNGLAFYVYENNERAVALWYVDGLTCWISGDISIDEMKAIIGSVSLE